MKKSLRPQQTAPVQRENTTTTRAEQNYAAVYVARYMDKGNTPFAGDDAE